MGDRRGQLLDGCAVLAAAAVAAVLFAVLGLPSPALFGGLLAGLVRALAFRRPDRRAAAGDDGRPGGHRRLHGRAGRPGDAARGRRQLAAGPARHRRARCCSACWPACCCGCSRGISPVTGAFALIAGGASGIIVMARELGADERMVAVLQYLRVLLIVVLMPVVATGALRRLARQRSGAGGSGPGWPVGAAVHRRLRRRRAAWSAGRLRLPVAALLGPMLLAAAVDLSGLGHGAPGARGGRRSPRSWSSGCRWASASPATAWPRSGGRCRWRWP